MTGKKMTISDDSKQVSVDISLPESDWEFLEKEAKDQGITLPELIVQIAMKSMESSSGNE